MNYQIYKVDAFASHSSKYRYFATGNPAAIVLSDSMLDYLKMSQLALELNEPITSFVYSVSPTEYKIMYFAQNGQHEKLCGHGTIAANIVLHQSIGISGNFNYITENNLKISAFIDKKNRMTSICLPSYKLEIVTDNNCVYYFKIKEMIERMFFYISHNDFQIYKNHELKDYIIQIINHYNPETFKIDFNELKNIIKSIDARSLSITTKPFNERHIDYQTKLFYSNLEELEDIACGSINSSIAPLWGKYFNKNKLVSLFPYHVHKNKQYGGIQYINLFDSKVMISSEF